MHSLPKLLVWNNDSFKKKVRQSPRLKLKIKMQPCATYLKPLTVQKQFSNWHESKSSILRLEKITATSAQLIRSTYRKKKGKKTLRIVLLIWWMTLTDKEFWRNNMWKKRLWDELKMGIWKDKEGTWVPSDFIEIKYCVLRTKNIYIDRSMV